MIQPADRVTYRNVGDPLDGPQRYEDPSQQQATIRGTAKRSYLLP
jgi:hypothetical protein